MHERITVDWNLGNSCNLSCSYCHWELNNGENPYPAIEKLSLAFDHLIDQCRAFSQIQIEFTGGEPTSSESVCDIILKHSNNIEFKLVSNGTADYKWWANIKHCLAEVTLTYHTTTDLSHFINVVNLLKDKKLTVFVAIPADRWDVGRYAYKTIQELHSNTYIQLLYKNFIRGNNVYDDYTHDQWKEYYQEQGIDISNNEAVRQTIEFKRVNKLNNYYGHMCWAGYTQIVVDNFGDVWRGWCKSDLCLGNVFQNTVNLTQKPKPCPRQQCRNGFDLRVYKSKGSWGIA